MPSRKVSIKGHTQTYYKECVHCGYEYKYTSEANGNHHWCSACFSYWHKHQTLPPVKPKALFVDEE